MGRGSGPLIKPVAMDEAMGTELVRQSCLPLLPWSLDSGAESEALLLGTVSDLRRYCPGRRLFTWASFRRGLLCGPSPLGPG
jgi:hypothetical protein